MIGPTRSLEARISDACVSASAGELALNSRPSRWPAGFLVRIESETELVGLPTLLFPLLVTPQLGFLEHHACRGCVQNSVAAKMLFISPPQLTSKG
jgi:hypothetical protein